MMDGRYLSGSIFVFVIFFGKNHTGTVRAVDIINEVIYIRYSGTVVRQRERG